MTRLSEWDSFYVIVGSAAGALIGLQFVVMTLIAERPPLRATEAGAAFATPTIIHFSVVLLLAALVRAPWGTIMPIAFLYGLIGLGGVVYSLVTARRMQAQSTYKPDLEDWLFHVWLPMVAYAVLAGSAVVGLWHLNTALFALGGATLLLLFSGIHNAWDAVTYFVFVNKGSNDQNKGP